MIKMSEKQCWKEKYKTIFLQEKHGKHFLCSEQYQQKLLMQI